MFADRFGPLNVIVPVTCMWLTVAFCWLAVKDVPSYYVFTCFYGISSGGFQSMIPTVVVSITSRLDMVGTRMGMAFSIVSFASLTGPPIGGALQGAAHGAFTGAQAWAASVTLIGSVLLLVTRGFKLGWKLKGHC